MPGNNEPGIDSKKYIGLHLDSFSIDDQTFTLNLARYSIPAEQATNLASLPGRAKLIFCRRGGVVLSKVFAGAEILGIEQEHDDRGRIVCTVRFPSEGFIRIAADEVVDFIF